LACGQAAIPLDRLSHSHLTALQHLAQRPQTGGAVSLPGDRQVVRWGDELRWQPASHPAPAAPADQEVLLTPPEAGTCTFLNWTFTWQTFAPPGGPHPFPPDRAAVWLDLDRLHLPLKLRTWRPGDRLRPRGLQGTKKLQDLFVDAKIPRQQRPFIPLLVSGGDIIWVVGLRRAAEAAVTPQTRRILQVAAQPAA
jgi:tRNA(Ile)-lysidine synthase